MTSNQNIEPNIESDLKNNQTPEQTIEPKPEKHHHSHSHPHSHSHSHTQDTLKTKLLQLLLAMVIVVITPFILTQISNQNLNRIRSQTLELTGGQNSENYRATITRVLKSEFGQDPFNTNGFFNQQLEGRLIDGPQKGALIDLKWRYNKINPELGLKPNDEVVIYATKDTETGETNYIIGEKYRLPQIFFIAFLFFLGVLVLAGIRGVSSFLSLVFSILVLAYYLIPQILGGGNPILTTFFAGLLITTISMFLGHGFNKKTSVAVGGTLFTITITAFFANWVVDLTNLTGAVEEESFYLQNALNQTTQGINLRGLLLSGIIVGTLGVLDDVTSTQSATVAEISEANPELGFWELVKRGMRVGQEHTISLVNTLALAYVGTSLPLLLLTTVYNTSELWVVLNSEIISSEIIRTLIGSMCLLLAVPVTTLLSAKFLQARKQMHSKKSDIDGNKTKLDIDLSITPERISGLGVG